MRYAFLLSAENLDLSKAELEALFCAKARRKGKLAYLDSGLFEEQVTALCERSAMIKRCYAKDRKIWQVHKGRFEGREPVDKPAFLPVALKPKLARLLINLTRAKKTILDPFCGGGSILIEAAILGLKPIGIDADIKSIEYAKHNLQHYRLKADVRPGDAIELNIKPNSIEAIATDPPYGRSSKVIGADLYKRFLEEAQRVLNKGGKLAMILPKSIKLPKSKLKLAGKYDLYVHKSLTRTIYILTK